MFDPLIECAQVFNDNYGIANNYSTFRETGVSTCTYIAQGFVGKNSATVLGILSGGTISGAKQEKRVSQGYMATEYDIT